jgi:DMSO reductase anchor subunit
MPVYLAFALMTGALGAHALLTLSGAASRWAGVLAICAVLLAFALKILSWRRLARSVPESSPESATGLAALGRVRMLDPPHTQTNYLLNEMGFRLGRKHASRLRRLSLASGLVGSLLLTSLALVSSGGLAAMFALLALAAGIMGVLLERWLFFAEARHTVMLYYGERTETAA